MGISAEENPDSDGGVRFTRYEAVSAKPDERTVQVNLLFDENFNVMPVQVFRDATRKIFTAPDQGIGQAERVAYLKEKYEELGQWEINGLSVYWHSKTIRISLELQYRDPAIWDEFSEDLTNRVVDFIESAPKDSPLCELETLIVKTRMYVDENGKPARHMLLEHDRELARVKLSHEQSDK